MAEKWLVIDDSATIQRVIKLAFQDYDVQISEADSVQEALRELTKNPSSLVIADAALAGVQSVQDFVRLRDASAGAAFVVLEGSYDHIDEGQFRSAGFRHFLKKPFDASQLIATTREALGRGVPKQGEVLVENLPPPAPHSRPFSLVEEEASPLPPPPGSGGRSLHDELEHPFDTSDGFDLGLSEAEEEEAREKEKEKAKEIEAAKDKALPKPKPALFQGATPEPKKEGEGESRKMFAEFGSETDPSFRYQPASKARLNEEAFEAPKSVAKPYFGDSESSSTQGQAADAFPKESSYDPRREPSYRPQALNSMLEPMLRNEMEVIVRQTVEEYCRKHFAELAREYLTREIEKLSSERSRLLVDK